MPEGLGGGIEQLHYTWAPRGAEGINQFQIAAISAGLKRPPLVSLLPDLRRLCRYDRPPGAEDGPASFGWLDLREHRVAFLRVPVPGVGGRSGSFAAHLLVGNPASLPEAEIASSFGAGFWWTGLTDGELDEIAAGKQGFELPSVDWDEARQTRVAPGEEAVEAAGALARDLLSLDGDERLAVLDDGAALGPALRTLGRWFPQAFAGISLSTYEVAPAFPFTVVGTPERPSGMRVCELDGELDPACRATARQLLGDHPDAELLRAAVGGLAGPAPGRPGGSRWEAAETLVGLASGIVTDPGPLAALTSPAVAAYLVHTEPGRERFAEIATRGSPQPLAALVGARERIAPAHLDALCQAFGRRFAASGEPRGCAGVLAALPSGPARERLEEEVLRTALRPDSARAEVGAEDAVALLQIAAARGLGADRCQPLLRQAAPHLGACAEHRAIPKPLLVAMLPLALEQRGAEAELCRALRRRPRLLIAALLGPDEERRWLTLARRLRSRQLEEALPALLAGLARQPRQELSALVGRVPGSAGRQALLAAGPLFENGELPPVLAALCEEWGAIALENGELETARRLLANGDSRDSQLAAKLLVGGRASTSERVRAAYHVGEIRDPTLRTAVFEAAVNGALRELRHPDDAGLVWSLLVSSYPGEGDEAILERLLGRAMRVPPASGQAALLAWLGASFLPAHPDLRKRNGQPRISAGAALTAALAERMSEREIERMTPFAEAADRRAARWWKDLAADRHKALKRRGH
jgi:GTPase-associated protein 1, N-terminal domain type 2